MNQRSFLVLTIAVLAMLAVLYLQRDDRAPSESELILPGLSAVLNDVERLQIVGAGGEPIATLQRKDGYWALVERNGYPADVGRIRSNLLALADAEIVERKTSDPSLYSRLGVEDVANEAAGGAEFIIDTPKEQFRIIVGKGGVRGDMTYVRRPGDEQAYLVAAQLDPGTASGDWLRKDLLDIDGARVHSIAITHPDGEHFFIEKPAPDGDQFTLSDMPENSELQYATILDSMAGLLSDLTFDDVAEAEAAAIEATSAITTRVTTFDGLIVDATIFESPDKSPDGRRVQFVARADEALASRFAPPDAAGEVPPDLRPFEDVGAAAERLNAELAGWAYTLPSFRTEQMTRRNEDVLKSADPATDAAASQAR